VVNYQGKSCSILLGDGRDEVVNNSDVTEPTVYRPPTKIKSNQLNNESKIPSSDKNNSSVMCSPDIEQLFKKHKNVFNETPRITKVYTHQISVKDESKFVRKTYPVPLHNQDKVDTEIQRMLDPGIIERSNSNFLNPIVVVEKKSGNIRLCLNMRNLNTIVKKNYDCAPNAESLFIKCQGVKYMSRLDLTSSFWQAPLEERSRKYTAFLYRNKCYHFKVVSFGLVTSLTAVVGCLELALGPEVEEYVSVFLGYILIISRSYEEHLQHLDNVFKKLKKANLVLSKDKCEFFRPEVKFLGHIISSEGIRTDPDKIESIVKFPIPRKTKDVRAFLALTGYYHRFAHWYSETVAPLLELLRKNQKWKWDAEHEGAFCEIKKILQEYLHYFSLKRRALIYYTPARQTLLLGVCSTRGQQVGSIK
jgi:hypothetical protein